MRGNLRRKTQEIELTGQLVSDNQKAGITFYWFFITYFCWLLVESHNLKAELSWGPLSMLLGVAFLLWLLVQTSFRPQGLFFIGFNLTLLSTLPMLSDANGLVGEPVQWCVSLTPIVFALLPIWTVPWLLGSYATNFSIFAGYVLLNQPGFDLTAQHHLLSVYGVMSGVSIVLGLIRNQNFRLQEARLASVLVRSESKDRVVSHLTRDLKNSMGPLIEALKYVEKMDLEPLSRFKPQVADSLQNTQDLLSNLLRWAAHRQERVLAQEGSVSVARLVVEVLDLFKHPGVTIRPYITPGLFVAADELMVKTMLQTLLRIGLKSSRPGDQIKIEVEQSKDSVLISVLDPGKSLQKRPDETAFSQERELRPGESPDSKLKTVNGLSICDTLARLCGGSVFIERNPGRETLYQLNLPLGEPDGLKRDAANGSEHLMMGLSVLLADKNELQRRVTQLALEKMGCLVDTARDGAEAVELFQKHQYQLVLSDIDMPVMGGVEANRLMRSADVPMPLAVALTSYTEKELVNRFGYLRFDCVLPKPMDRQKLLAIVQNNLGKISYAPLYKLSPAG